MRQQLGERLRQGWESILLAVDGDVTSDVHAQSERLPSSATHLVISTGGNDALGLTDLLGQSANSFSQVLGALGEVAPQFRCLCSLPASPRRTNQAQGTPDGRPPVRASIVAFQWL